MGSDSNSRVTFIARTNFRDDRRLFGIKQADRRAHMYLIGKTGTGKSTLLETLARQDIQAGEGAAAFDPHGGLLERLIVDGHSSPEAELLFFKVPSPIVPLCICMSR